MWDKITKKGKRNGNFSKNIEFLKNEWILKTYHKLNTYNIG